MAKFNYFTATYQAFYSKAFYRDVVRHWGAGTCWYLFLLLAISWAIMMTVIQPVFSRGGNAMVQLAADQVPDISIKDGIASTPENRPYFIKDPNGKDVIAIIDTSGKYTKLESGAENMLLTKNQFWMIDHQGVVKIYELPKTLTMDIKPKVIQTTVSSWLPWSWTIIFPLCLIVSFIYRLVEALIYAVIGKIFALIAEIKISYTDVYKLTIMSLTPAIIVATIIDFFGVVFPKVLLCYFALSMAYLIYGILANRTTDK